MKALVIYDSVFGNTEKVAKAIANALGSPNEVTAARVGDVQPEMLAGLDLLVVGSPTRGFRPTEPMKKFLQAMPTLKGVKAAAFDTRMVVKEVNNALLTVMVKIFGYAAEPIGKALQKKGASLALPPEGFFVKGSEGPMKDGELERAANWARKLLSA